MKSRDTEIDARILRNYVDLTTRLLTVGGELRYDDLTPEEFASLSILRTHSQQALETQGRRNTFKFEFERRIQIDTTRWEIMKYVAIMTFLVAMPWTVIATLIYNRGI